MSMTRLARWIRPEDDERLKGMFDGERVLHLRAGQHRVVAERRGAPAGAIIAREVLIEGAQAECSGLMEAVIFGGLLRAGYKVRVTARGGRVEADCAEVTAEGKVEIAARRTSIIYAMTSESIIYAFDGSIVVIDPDYPPQIRIHDRAHVLELNPLPTIR
jgi:hypothetical protein